MNIAGLLLVIIGLVAAVPLQMIFPFPYGLGMTIIIIVAGIYVLVKRRQVRSPPLEILKKRYAKGEITKEEFDKMKEDLS